MGNTILHPHTEKIHQQTLGKQKQENFTNFYGTSYQGESRDSETHNFRNFLSKNWIQFRNMIKIGLLLLISRVNFIKNVRHPSKDLKWT